VLKKASSYKGLNIFGKRRILALISCVVSAISSMPPAIAISARFGVVKTTDNASQWNEITKRLQATGVDYCIVDASRWQDESALGQTRVLLFPNVDNLDQRQAIALERWMGRGGRVIVTGPTGNLSQPQVRDQLRSLFGAYWGFSNSSPTALEALGGPVSLAPQQETIATIIGGTLIRTSGESQPAAVWLNDERQPAVLVSNRATVIGWRWGSLGVTSPDYDIAWLEAALRNYGLTRYNELKILERSQPSSCQDNDSLLPSRQPQESEPTPTLQDPQNRPPVAP
jgi:extradiol dioxygenase family protein